MHVHFLLNTRDAFDTSSHIHRTFAGNDALRGQGNRLQTRRTKAVDGHARHGDGQSAFQGNLARDVGARGALGVGATHDHVLHLSGINAGAGHGMLHRVAT